MSSTHKNFSGPSRTPVLPEVHKSGKNTTSHPHLAHPLDKNKKRDDLHRAISKQPLKGTHTPGRSNSHNHSQIPRTHTFGIGKKTTASTSTKRLPKHRPPNSLTSSSSTGSLNGPRNSLDSAGKKYYEGNGDQFFRTLELPPLDDEGFAEFEPESLGPDLCIIFRRMLNYKFRNKHEHILKTLEDLNMLCVRALPDIPVAWRTIKKAHKEHVSLFPAIEFAKEVDLNARMRPRAFALCGEDMLPKYYAIEYTPPKIALLNCLCCMSCFRQPFNLAIFGLDGNLALRIVSAPLENCWFSRYAKECCCHQGVAKRMLIKGPDNIVIGSLVEFGHCFMTQWLQIHPGVPTSRGDLADAAVVQWQSKCRCMDATMLYCGCKTDTDAEGAMIMADKAGRKYATARPWSGVTSEDASFLFTIRFTEKCPIEMKALALTGSFIYNNLNWETKSDLTCCMLISCLFCSLRLWYDGGPGQYDYDNWSNLPTSSATSYLPWTSLNRPAVANYRRI